MNGNNTIDRSKLGQAKRHILTDKKGIPLSAVITSANEHDIKAVTVVFYNAVIKLCAAVTTFLSITKTRRTIRRQHLYALKGHTTLNSQNKGDIKLDHVPQYTS
jgi:hypothetical protein